MSYCPVAHPDLYGNMLTWAQQRATFESCGLVAVSADGDDAWSKVLLELKAGRSMPLPQLPDGMTAPWRARVTRIDDYSNALDLVLVNGSGALAGFCVAWLRQRASGEWVGQIEPLGLREDVRGRKLSRQLMAEAVRRLRAHGAARIFAQTDRQRAAALAAYRAMSFVEAHDVRVYRYSLT